LDSRNNLAAAYESEQPDRAIQLYEANLADSERVLGPDHPSARGSGNNLALTYNLVGRLDQAIQLYEANLTERERVLGPDHPSTLISRTNLAGALLPDVRFAHEDAVCR
jgi:tetratricopeptide (TPR) repeat protein